MSKNVFDSAEFARNYAGGKLGDMVKDGAIPPRMLPVYEFLNNIAGSAGSVLDIACATANFRKNLVEWNIDAHYTGADYSGEMLAVARESDPGASLVRVKLPNLPFADNAFDTVISLSTLNFVPELEESFIELIRVSRRYLIFEVFCYRGEDSIQTRYYSATGEAVPIVLPGFATVQAMIVNAVKNNFLAGRSDFRIMTTNPLHSGFKDIVPLGHTTLFHYFVLIEKT